MSNETEREAAIQAIEEKYGFHPNQLCLLFGRDIEWAFQAGAAYQREQDKKLVEAVGELFEARCALKEFEAQNPNDSTKRWDAYFMRVESAEEALYTAYKASQEGK